uniref:NADH-ubiquinone oxidoreductase chain 6 n=1 Tax=Hippodamia convergens TaxID=64696 RepID=A0A1V0IGP3_HIPCN|nr:NADH dehydrogenase subunit 6 [Hippodamia convergens]ARC95516.1 NADH dehydrogenase subunit 6 [Hippodamia convergens]
MYLLMLTSTLMMFLKHPLSLGLNILIHTILTCLMLGLMSMNFWFSYILILIMIGGLLVLFIYMTSIASNEKFNLNKTLVVMTLMVMFILIVKLLNKEIYNLEMNNELVQNFQEMNFFFNLNKYINYPNSNIFIMIMFYLLIAMIAVIKISKSSFGPLRQFKYENTFT